MKLSGHDQRAYRKMQLAIAKVPLPCPNPPSAPPHPLRSALPARCCSGGASAGRDPRRSAEFDVRSPRRRPASTGGDLALGEPGR